MSEAIIYSATGEILRLVSAPSEMLVMQKQAGEFILFGDANDLTDYIYQGEIVARATQPTTLNKLTLTADGIDTITLSNAPSGTFTATNTTTRETVTGAINGTDSFLTTIQGTYKIKIESWPYLDFEVTINAL